MKVMDKIVPSTKIMVCQVPSYLKTNWYIVELGLSATSHLGFIVPCTTYGYQPKASLYSWFVNYNNNLKKQSKIGSENDSWACVSRAVVQVPIVYTRNS